MKKTKCKKYKINLFEFFDFEALEFVEPHFKNNKDFLRQISEQKRNLKNKAKKLR